MVNITNYKLCFRTDDEGNKILNASNCFKLDFEREIDIQRQETLNFKRLKLSPKVFNGKGLVPLFTEDSSARCQLFDLGSVHRDKTDGAGARAGAGKQI